MDLSRRNQLVVYTAIAGRGRDDLVDPVPAPGVDYVCFTDQPLTSKIWDIRPFAWTHLTQAVRTAKHPKVLPHEYFPDHSMSIWIDANIAPSPDIAKVAEFYLSRYDLALHRHPRRDCLYKEAEVVSEVQKDFPSTIDRIISRYSQNGMPHDFGLWECGILFRRHLSPDIVTAMELWWREIEAGSQSDQIHWAYVVWKLGLKFRTIDGNLRESPFFRYKPHPAIYWGAMGEAS